MHKEDGKETFVLFLELKCTFAKVGSHLQSYNLCHNFDEIYPSRYPSQRNAALHCSDICFHIILYDIILFSIKIVTSLSLFALEKQQGKIVVFSH